MGATTRTAGSRAKAAYNQKDDFGGRARRKLRGAMGAITSLRASVPSELEHVAEGYRFKTEKASRDQVEQLRKLIIDHCQRFQVGSEPELSAEVLAAVTSLSPPTVRGMLAKGLPASRDAAGAATTARMLSGMLTGRLAGVLGYSRVQDPSWLFKLAAGCNFERYADVLSREHPIDLRRLYAAFLIDYRHVWTKM